MSVTDELVQLIDDETLIYRDIKTQYHGYDVKKVAIWSTNEEFLFGLLYDLFDGHIFGIDTVVEVLLLVEEDQLSVVETVYCNFMISGLPKFKDLKISSYLQDMKNADYLIIHHEFDWGPPSKRKSLRDHINDNFDSMRTWGKKINRYLPRTCQILLIGDCLSIVRLIIGLYTPDFPQDQIHGITRHYERAAACVLANKINVPMREIKGVGVFGEDIIETTNSWVEHNIEDHENEVYEESVILYMPKAYELIKTNEELGGDSVGDWMSQDLGGIKTGKTDRVSVRNADPQPSGDSRREREVYPPFGVPEYLEDGPGWYICDWLKVGVERGWLADTVRGLQELPEEWTGSTDVEHLLDKTSPVKSLRWVVGRFNDEKFHCHSLPKKCKAEQSGYSQARGVSDWIVFFLKKSDSPKRTNALVCSPGIYSVPSGLFFSFPIAFVKDSRPRIVLGYAVSETTALRIAEKVKELKAEYDYIMQLYEDFPADYDPSEKASPISSVLEGERPFEEEEDETAPYPRSFNEESEQNEVTQTIRTKSSGT